MWWCRRENSNINSSSIKEKQEVRIITFSTMCKYLIICILLVFFVDKSSAQIAIAVAKEENYPFSAIEWRVEWGLWKLFRCGTSFHEIP